MNKSKRKRLLVGPYLFWSLAFIIIPLLMVIYYGFTSADNGFTLKNVALTFERENLKALAYSLGLSALSTAICFLLAYPLALILRNSKIKTSSFIIFVFVLPMWMNFLLRTFAWQTLLERNGVINSLLSAMHLPNIHLINTSGAIILGMVYNFLPFMVLPIYNSLVKIDNNVINAARDLGANGRQTLFHIILPLSMPGIISGITMVFVPSLTTFVISDILGGGKIWLIGNIIEQEFKLRYNWHTGSGLSLVLMVFILISMAFIAKYDKDMEGTNVW